MLLIFSKTNIVTFELNGPFGPFMARLNKLQQTDN